MPVIPVVPFMVFFLMYSCTHCLNPSNNLLGGSTFLSIFCNSTTLSMAPRITVCVSAQKVYESLVAKDCYFVLCPLLLLYKCTLHCGLEKCRVHSGLIYGFDILYVGTEQ